METEIVACENCGILRLGEIDARFSEKECRATAEESCKVCGCPYVKRLKEVANVI